MKLDFSQKIIHWYNHYKRDLPWRNTTDPYTVWLSEIILQQTRVSQGLPYFIAFKEKYPTILDLAEANEQEVLKLWQGLGYYSRARNLHATAQYVSHELQGKFPSNFKALLKLKGVGNYTAAAIASFCFKEAVPVIDGNVYRVLSRVFNIETPINESKAYKEYYALAQALIDPNQPGLFNQAIMEFGALQCTPQNPDCENCPFRFQCESKKLKIISKRPVKTQKIKIRKRYFDYLILDDPKGRTIIHKRTQKDIWKHLYEFPKIEHDKPINEVKIVALFKSAFKEFGELKHLLLLTPNTIKHKLTHQEIYVRFWKAEVSIILENGISMDKLYSYPVPIVLQNFLEKYNQ
jgi:A/G-specific adenine glycosylase